MSNTKGSMLISNANAVGTELVNQLGGTGYKPSEWSGAINLLGISDDDKASALAGITEGTYTGSERGAIKYSNCNAVGAMLNKKFSTNRGFKPVEWESAISKLTPLAEGTVSGSVCNIVNGADSVPLKNWLVTLPASLDGYTSVTAYKAKKNIVDFNSNLNASSYGCTIEETVDKGIRFYGTTTQTYLNLTTLFDVDIASGVTFTFSRATARPYRVYVYLKFDDNTTANVIINQNTKSVTYTTTKKVVQIRLDVSGLTASTAYDETIYPMLEVGSTATAYEAYEAPTQYTASLGRTIYGGTADIVTGEGENDRLKYELDENDSWSAYGGATHSFWHNVATGEDRPIDQTKLTQCICNELTYSTTAPQSAPDFTFIVQGGQRIVVTADSSIDTVDKFKTWLSSHNLVFICPASTPETFTFEPITPTPDTELGVNNFWSEQGDSSITYRKDPDIPDPPVQLLNMNNNENNNNEGV